MTNSTDDNFAVSRSVITNAAKALGVQNPDASLVDALVKDGHSLVDVGRYTPQFLNVALRQTLARLNVAVPRAPAPAPYKDGPALNPFEKLKHAYAMERAPERDPRELEIERLQRQSMVKPLDGMERATLHSLQWTKTPDAAPPLTAEQVRALQDIRDPQRRLERQRQIEQASNLRIKIADMKRNADRLAKEPDTALIRADLLGQITAAESTLARLEGRA